jgi:RHS repeat-associated protein
VDIGTDNTADFYQATVLSATDYYAFGMSMKERSWQSDGYRYGFNGKENDTDWEVQDYGFRIYKPEISKFLSVDPLTQSYPWYTPYQFAGNSPIENDDLDGAEPRSCNKISDHAVYLGDAKLKVERSLDKKPKFKLQDAKVGLSRNNIYHKNYYPPHEKAMQLGADIGDVATLPFAIAKWSIKAGKFLRHVDISVPKNTLFSGIPINIDGIKLNKITTNETSNIGTPIVNSYLVKDDLYFAGAKLNANGELLFSINVYEDIEKTRKIINGASAYAELYNTIADIAGEHNIKSIEAYWNEGKMGTNLDQFNKYLLEHPKASLEEAAINTWAGQRAKERGFKYVEDINVTGKRGEYTHVNLFFTR